MNRTLVISVFIICFNSLRAQDIEILYGMNYFYSRPIENSNGLLRTHIDNNDPFLKGRFEWFLYKVISLLASYHYYSSWVSVEIGTDEERAARPMGRQYFANGGSSRADAHRFGIGVGRRQNLYRDILVFKYRFILNSEYTIEVGSPSPSTSGVAGRYVYSLFAYADPGIQVIPELNTGLILKLYRGIALTVDYSYLRGFRGNMYADVTYTIDGEMQPIATFYNRGTSHHLMIGLNLRLWKRKE